MANMSGPIEAYEKLVEQLKNSGLSKSAFFLSSSLEMICDFLKKALFYKFLSLIDRNDVIIKMGLL